VFWVLIRPGPCVSWAHGFSVLCMEHPGHAIRAMREAQDLSLRHLARLADVEPGYLSQVERGLKNPSKRWLDSVTEALGRNLAGRAAS
jgi:transcriptional regulator with XRE-family HTH domain